MFFGPLKIGPVAGLRMRATVLSPVETSDEIGGVTRSFNTVATIWCRLEPVLGDETFADGLRTETVAFRVSMRWRSDIAANMRLAIGSRLFLITASADPDGRRRRLIVLCEEIKP